ncbi:ArnT family glycosyltransferase [Flagellimonas marinaquae]
MEIIKKYDYMTLFIVGLVICTSCINLYPIYILDEARNAEAAREMLASGNFLVPFFNGELRTDKPPLHYYFMAAGYQLFGVNALGARFFSGFFGALTLLVTYWGIKKSSEALTAGITVVILLSAIFFINEFHLAVPDPYLIFFFTLALFSGFNLYKTGKLTWFFIMYVSMGLGVLTKGPIAIVLPGITIPVFLLLKNDLNWKTIRRFKPILGLITVLLIAMPWYYLVHLETDGVWTEGFFLEHNLSRFGAEKEGHGGPFFVTPFFVILGLLPFSVFVFQSFTYAWRTRKANDLGLFSWVVAIVTILFFSISRTKLPNYPMLCYPFVGYLIAYYLQNIYHGKISSKSIAWSLYGLLFLSSVLPIAGYLALSIEKQFFEIRHLALLLLFLPLASILGVYFYRQGKQKGTFVAMAGGWLLTGFLLFGVIFPQLTKRSPVSLALEQIDTQDRIVAYKRFDSAFPINFKRTFRVFQSLEDVKGYKKDYPKTYIITNTRDKEDLKLLEEFELILQQKALFENHVTRIYLVK